TGNRWRNGRGIAARTWPQSRSPPRAARNSGGGIASDGKERNLRAPRRRTRRRSISADGAGLQACGEHAGRTGEAGAKLDHVSRASDASTRDTRDLPRQDNEVRAGTCFATDTEVGDDQRGARGHHFGNALESLGRNDDTLQRLRRSRWRTR